MKKFQIKAAHRELLDAIDNKIDNKTKPIRSLGKLEDMARKVAMVQNTLQPELKNPHMLIFAADHGIAEEGVSAYPSEVTQQMVHNFLNDGAAINVFSRQNDMKIKVVNAGVNHDFTPNDKLLDYSVGKGTKNMLYGAAMNTLEFSEAIDKGVRIINELHEEGCNVVGFGEMGIGNTSSAALLMSALCHLPIEQCVGRGTGVTDGQFKHKLRILKAAQSANPVEKDNPVSVLKTFGGFEIVMMCGAMLRAAELKMLILVDGFISSSAFLGGFVSYPYLKDYAIFTHQSNESGHRKMLEYIGAPAILDLNLRLGEGTGAALMYPILESAVNFFNEMASFESAGVSDKM
ncbi:nicotinate-nucleotide--dimethylbenzimidazole phosphoribosyltransferase [Sediminitomix flava]|uniref:Nicotinate-nucleotide--dimethylbenzimidazole phosphoribosyltransferase n=1 Tax=Sediminitomix flava TaxID=379075 RepID=A0A315Z9J9_SEDFL|nr:nicotinate-nucleotide--dimethylbenzimidazole phosphoribosyltransferase [Sediminitomix flava]PWJ40874.1 nicotinate-nucleotide-dimethylbenzimidazole phosphoribosyltransferase [Sediminitomix flava]